MTKVQLHYHLLRPLDDDDMDGIARVHSVYGIMRVKVQPSLDAITVDYDASRLSEKDLEASLVRCGVPIQRFVATV